MFSRRDDGRRKGRRARQTRATSDRSRLAAAASAIGEDLVPTRTELERSLAASGFTRDDTRLTALFEGLSAFGPSDPAPVDDLAAELDRRAGALLARALAGELAAANFPRLRKKMKEAFDLAYAQRDGTVASYIPALERVPPNLFGASFCSVDGQVCDFGDFDAPFTIQSVHKPLSYALALTRHGADKVHGHVGVEPSGRRFNDLTFDDKGRPHNPMVNAGAIMSAALIDADCDVPTRAERLLRVLSEMAGGRTFTVDEEVFESELATADRNFALAYMMRENRALPEGADIMAALQVYFRFCAIVVTTRDLARVAATLANDGACAFSGAAPIPRDHIGRTLCVMFTCGTYDQSGTFAFKIGAPSKSGVSGGMMVIAPGLGGFATFSPRLDGQGQSVRGTAFAEGIAKSLDLSMFLGARAWTTASPTLHRSTRQATAFEAFQWFSAARVGEVAELRRLLARGTDVNITDYDGRTALHIAIEDDRGAAVRYLRRKGARLDAVNRNGETGLELARRLGHDELVALLEDAPAS